MPFQMMSEQVEHENGPGAEFHDTERQALVGELEKLFLNRGVTPELWAFIWLSDLDMLKTIVETAREESKSPFPLRMLTYLTWCVQNGKVVQRWCQLSRPALPDISTPMKTSPTGKSRTTPKHTSPLQSTTLAQAPTTGRKRRRKNDSESSDIRHSTGSRSKTASSLCRERDNNLCIITHADTPVEVAHIFPYCLRSTLIPNSIRHEFSIWSILGCFWSQERIRSWLKELTTPEGTERVENLLTLAPSVHKYHERTLFALKPENISEDGKILTATFYWMPRIVHSSPTIRLSTTPSIPHDLTMRGDASRSVRLYDVPTDTKICSGDKIRIQTDDPEKLPLPSMELLSLQWVLQRVAVLTGAGEMEAEMKSDDDSDYSAAYDIYDQELQSDTMINEWIQTVPSQEGSEPEAAYLRNSEGPWTRPLQKDVVESSRSEDCSKCQSNDNCRPERNSEKYSYSPDHDEI